MKRKFTSLTLTSAILISALSLSACQSNQTYETTDLMTGIKAASHETVKPDDAFKSAYGNFSVELLKKCFYGKSNTLISPLSVSSALAMTAMVQTVRPKMKWKRYSGAECPLTN